MGSDMTKAILILLSLVGNAEPGWNLILLFIAARGAGIGVLPEVFRRIEVDGRTVNAVPTGDRIEQGRRAVVHGDLHIADEFVRAVRVELVGEDTAAAGFGRSGRSVLIRDHTDAAVLP